MSAMGRAEVPTLAQRVVASFAQQIGAVQEQLARLEKELGGVASLQRAVTEAGDDPGCGRDRCYRACRIGKRA
jgi:hypothetical protein